MQLAELKAQINETIEDQLRANGAVQLAWIVNKLVQECDFAEEEHEEQSMRLLAAREGFRNIVGVVNRERRGQETDPEAPEQFVLPGFDRLQRAYSIVRRKEEWIVGIDKMSLAELLAKRSQLVKMRQGIGEHIREIDAYIRQRWPDAA
jgi:hypothetical protein